MQAIKGGKQTMKKTMKTSDYFPKQKVGVLILVHRSKLTETMPTLNCEVEPDLIWYALPTVGEIFMDYHSKRDLSSKIVTTSNVMDEGEMYKMRPTWSRTFWKCHEHALNYLKDNRYSEYHVICAGYKNAHGHDAQVGITGTVGDKVSSESFWECAIRESKEECNVDISEATRIEYFVENETKRVYVVSL